LKSKDADIRPKTQMIKCWCINSAPDIYAGAHRSATVTATSHAL